MTASTFKFRTKLFVFNSKVAVASSSNKKSQVQGSLLGSTCYSYSAFVYATFFLDFHSCLSDSTCYIPLLSLKLFFVGYLSDIEL